MDVGMHETGDDTRLHESNATKAKPRKGHKHNVNKRGHEEGQKQKTSGEADNRDAVGAEDRNEEREGRSAFTIDFIGSCPLADFSVTPQTLHS